MKLLSILGRTFSALIQKPDEFHVKFALGKNTTYSLWECPGRWCSDAILNKMVDEMRIISSAGQRGKDIPHYGVLIGAREDLAQRVICIIHHHHENTVTPVAFAALRYLDIPLGTQIEKVLHQGLVVVSPSFQGEGFPGILNGAAGFLLLFRRGLRPMWVSNVSQVPAVIGVVAQGYAEVFPHYLPNKKQSYEHLILGREIMNSHRNTFGVGKDAGFDEVGQIITNAYTGGSEELKKTFDEAPKHRLQIVNDFCKASLNYERGDDFLQLGKCSFSSMLSFAGSKLPKGGLAPFLFQGLVLFCLGVLTPIIRWYVPKPEIGE